MRIKVTEWKSHANLKEETNTTNKTIRKEGIKRMRVYQNEKGKESEKIVEDNEKAIRATKEEKKSKEKIAKEQIRK